MPSKCIWKEEEGIHAGGGDYQTSCDNMFSIIDGNPKNNGFRYCTYCGEKLVEKETQKPEVKDGDKD